jgi:hypothetical protein
METFQLRKKLVQQFDKIIKNDDKLVALEGVLGALEWTNSKSKIPEKHLKGESERNTWEEVKAVLFFSLRTSTSSSATQSFDLNTLYEPFRHSPILLGFQPSKCCLQTLNRFYP